MNNESLIPRTSLSTSFYGLATVALSILGLVYLEGILKPLVIAILIWFVINRLKIMIGKIKIGNKSLPSWACNLLALVIIVSITFMVVELLISNLEGIIASMPEYVANMNDQYDEATAFINDPKYSEYFQKWINGLNISALATSLLNSLSGVVASLAVVIVYVIFLLLEDTARKDKISSLFPVKGKQYKKFNSTSKSIEEAIRSYLWSKTVISLITGIISYIILVIMGVDYAFLWSFLIFIMNFIPYIGPLISSLLPAIFAVLSTGNIWKFVYVFAAMEGVQIIIGNFIEPKVMGKSTNLGPVVVIVALAFWGMIWGIAGMILAVPISSVIVIICSRIPSARYLAVLFSEKGNLPEIED